MVRDAAAGVGTLTFYEPSTGEFGALGHGINDVDTYELIDIANGELVTTNIVDIVKGKDGTPGEIRRSNRWWKHNLEVYIKIQAMSIW